MEKLTNLFGNHLEKLAVLYQGLQTIVENPTFCRIVRAQDEGTIKIAEYFGEYRTSPLIEIPNLYNGHTCIVANASTRYSQFLLHGQPVMIVNDDTVIISEPVNNNGNFQMVQFRSDRNGYLFVKYMRIISNSIEIENSIYDEHGVELQKDTLSDEVPESIKRVMASVYKYSAECSKSIREFLMGYQFDCMLGHKPNYSKTSKTRYLGYRRNLAHFDSCRFITDWGDAFTSRLSLTSSPAVMKTSEGEVNEATRGDLATSIALEENEETRNAMINYCASRGVTSKMVTRFREEILLTKNNESL